MNTIDTIAKGLPMLDMTECERRLLCFLVEHNRRNVWAVTQGNHLSLALAIHMDWNESSVRSGLKRLKDRDWVFQSFDKNGRQCLLLTHTLHQECDLALTRRMVRSAAGVKLCSYYQLTTEDIDKLHVEALRMQDAAKAEGDYSKIQTWVAKATHERYPHVG